MEDKVAVPMSRLEIGGLAVLGHDLRRPLTVQSAEAVLPGYSAGAPIIDQVQSAEQSANGAISQGDKTMAEYLAKVQARVNQSSGYADTASKQHC